MVCNVHRLFKQILFVKFGNLLVLALLWKRREHWSKMHLFILHLSIADLLVAFFLILPEWLIRMLCGFHAGDVACKYATFLSSIFVLFFCNSKLPVNSVVKHITIGAGGLGSILKPVKSDTVSPTARQRCAVASQLCCPGAMSRSGTPPLVYTLQRNLASIMKIRFSKPTK